MKQEKMTESEIVAFIGRKVEQSLNNDDGDLSQVRKDSFDFYNGEDFGNERDGYSSIVTREALEAVEWALPSMLKPFVSGTKAVVFNPVGMEDEEQAAQDTEVVNHLLLKENDGYYLFYCWIKDILMYPNGYVKAWIDESEKVTTESYKGLNENELTMLSSDPDLEIVEAESYPETVTQQVPNEMGIITEVPVQIELYDVKCKRTENQRKLVVNNVAPDQLLIDNDLAHISLDDADFIAHRVRRNFTWLVNNGYDPDELEKVGLDGHHEWNDERVNRMFYEDENPDTESDDDDSMREYWVHECYVKLDTDGDGLAENRKIVMIGDKIFENEEYADQPFIACSAILMSHKHAGMSLVDIEKAYQQVKSALTRNLLDNVYRINTRRKYVGENALVDGGMTMDALLNAASEIIPTRDPASIIEETIQPIIGEILPAIQEIDKQRRTATGIAPDLSLDPNVLQQSTEGAYQTALNTASERLETMTRNFAEIGVKPLFRKCHRLIREYMDKPLTIKIRGQWADVDPSDWIHRENMDVNVGLGRDGQGQKINNLMTVLGMQRETMPLGLSDRQTIFNTSEKIVEAMGEDNPETFFLDPKKTPPPQPQPDPTQMTLEATMQIEGNKVQSNERIKMAELQAKGQSEAASNQLNTEKTLADVSIKERELNLKEQELVLKEMELNAKNETESAKLANELDKLRKEAEKMELEKYKIDRDFEKELVRIQTESDKPKESEKPQEIHVHTGGNKKISVKRTPDGLEGESTEL